MEDKSVALLIVVLAVATPALAGVIWFSARSGAMQAPRKGRLLALFLAGPLNLVLWWLLNGKLSGARSSSVMGILAAIVVFVALGFGMGFLKRDAPRETPGDSDRGGTGSGHS